MRVLIALFIFILAMLAPWYVTLLFAIPYAFWRPAYELIPMGILVDATFGPGVVPFNMYYTVGAVVLVTAAEIAKPHLAFYAADGAGQ